uniref:mycofactocin-associated electron transfer flavoprotein beta subunit n=1 Tax=Allosalinactinospora lopnorensis TaxID=1352348 RepID=UPI0012E0FC10
ALAAGSAGALRVDASGPVSPKGELSTAPLLGGGRSVARALASAIRTRHGRPDLVLCGDRSADCGTGALPGFLAAELGAAQALGAVWLRDAGPGRLLVHRRLDQGRREELRVGSPAVVSVEAAGVHLRRASLPAVVASRHTRIPVVTGPAAHGATGPRVLGSGPYRPRTHALAPPPGDEPVQRLRALTGALSDRTPPRVAGPLPPGEAVDELLNYLRERGYLPHDGEVANR